MMFAASAAMPRLPKFHSPHKQLRVSDFVLNLDLLCHRQPLRLDLARRSLLEGDASLNLFYFTG